MIEIFLIATAAIVFWKLIGFALEEMRFRNNRD